MPYFSQEYPVVLKKKLILLFLLFLVMVAMVASYDALYLKQVSQRYFKGFQRTRFQYYKLQRDIILLKVSGVMLLALCTLSCDAL